MLNQQSLVVIILFSEEILEYILEELKLYLPSMHSFVKASLDEQVRTFSKKAGQAAKHAVSIDDVLNILGQGWPGFRVMEWIYCRHDWIFCLVDCIVSCYCQT